MNEITGDHRPLGQYVLTGYELASEMPNTFDRLAFPEPLHELRPGRRAAVPANAWRFLLQFRRVVLPNQSGSARVLPGLAVPLRAHAVQRFQLPAPGVMPV